MTKTYCDICGQDIISNPVDPNKYWVKIKPYTIIDDGHKQVNAEVCEICYKCASNIVSCIRSMHTGIY